MKADKVAWVIGQNPVDKFKIRQRGYAIREFKLKRDLVHAIDEQPDLVIFSEADIKDFSILSHIRKFFPDVIVLSLPPQPVEHETFFADAAEITLLEESMTRLLKAIRKIENN